MRSMVNWSIYVPKSIYNGSCYKEICHLQLFASKIAKTWTAGKFVIPISDWSESCHVAMGIKQINLKPPGMIVFSFLEIDLNGKISPDSWDLFPPSNDCSGCIFLIIRIINNITFKIVKTPSRH